MKITISTKDCIVVDQIDLDGWDFEKPLAKTALVERIIFSLRCARDQEEDGEDETGQG